MIIILHAAHNANESIGTAGPIGKGVLAIISRLGIGVPMFFVISGYCIAATSDSARRKPRAPARFFYRRFSRIFPPYWALTLISIVLAVALTAAGQGDLISGEYGYIPHPSILSWPQWLGNLSLTETWRPHLFGDPELKVVGPAWTLCYEEQFYAVCGLILVLAPRHFFACVTAVTLLTLIVAPIAITRPDQFPIQGFFFDGRWLMFAEGVAVYYILNYMQSQIPGISLVALLLVATAALRWGFPAVAADPLSRQRSWELVGSTAFALGLLLLHPWDLQAACARILHPIAVCGQMCYSLYLVHWPVTVVLTAAFYRAGVYGLWPTLLIVAPATIATSIAASWLFHLTVERRFLNPPNVPPKPN
jgi:peptidoglycan/LPS O-acetylase OafA/YrhL